MIEWVDAPSALDGIGLGYVNIVDAGYSRLGAVVSKTRAGICTDVFTVEFGKTRYCLISDETIWNIHSGAAGTLKSYLGVAPNSSVADQINELASPLGYARVSHYLLPGESQYVEVLSETTPVVTRQDDFDGAVGWLRRHFNS